MPGGVYRRLLALARKRGIAIAQVSLGDYPHPFGLLLQYRTSAHIILNRDDPLYERCFTLAHELGHYCLGHQGTCSMSDEERKRYEDAADRFARKLLTFLQRRERGEQVSVCQTRSF